MADELTESALRYHRLPRPGKIEVVPTKPLATQRDLSLAYSPGVAAPVEAIARNPADAARYTARSNLVAVISNGTAILGLGNLGALASKPVMEGKSVLFKRFSDVDSIGHVNNAAYLDVLMDAALGPLARAGWGLDRLATAGLAPFVSACDIEYLDGAVWGDALWVTTWMAPAPRGFEVVQHLGRADADDVLVRARTRWQWHAGGGEVVEAPRDLADVLGALAAA